MQLSGSTYNVRIGDWRRGDKSGSDKRSLLASFLIFGGLYNDGEIEWKTSECVLAVIFGVLHLIWGVVHRIACGRLGRGAFRYLNLWNIFLATVLSCGANRGGV